MADSQESQYQADLEGLFQTTHDAVFILNNLEDQLILDANQSARSLMGYTINDLRGKKFFDFAARGEIIDYDHGKRLQKIFLHTSSGSTCTMMAKILQRKSTVLIVGKDITERLTIEGKLQHRLKVEELIAQTSSRFINLYGKDINKEIDKTLKESGVLVKSDRCYVFTKENGKFFNSHEWVADGIAPLMGMQNEEDPKIYWWIHAQLYDNKTVHLHNLNELPDSEKELQNALRSQGIVSTLAVPIFSSQGLIGFLGFDNLQKKKRWSREDIDLLKVIGEVFAHALDRLKFESNLQKANDQLTEMNLKLEKMVDERTAVLSLTNEKLIEAIQELDHFVYRAAHDLKGPIKRILGLAHVARHDCDDLTSKNYAGMFHKTALDMDRELSKLLEVNNVRRYAVEMSHVNIHDVINDTFKQISIYLNYDRVNIKLDQKTDFIINTSHYLISTILINLIENALFFSQKGRNEPEVTIAYGTKGAHFYLHVLDNGLGILPEVKPRIFEMFFRGTNDTIGNGLGLYLVDRALEKLDGEIDIESKLWEFTEVRLKIPLQKED